MKLPALAALSLLLACSSSRAQTVLFAPDDSIKIEQLLAAAPALDAANEYMAYFGRQLLGTPYAAHTLEKGLPERLVINLRAFDCTTFVETALALTLCRTGGKTAFSDFCNALQAIRYDGGEVSYARRNHYFTSWIEANSAAGIVSEGSQDELPADLFCETQTLNISFMTAHPDLYPALAADSLLSEVNLTELLLTGKKFKFIPKRLLLRATKALKSYIRDGDIIAIVTNKAGLDIAHIGIAAWHADGTLHLLNASQTRKKAVDEPLTLYNYLRRNPAQTGIRVVKVL